MSARAYVCASECANVYEFIGSLLRDHWNVYFIAHYFHNSFTHNLKAKYLNSNYIYIKFKTIAISVSPMSLFIS